MKYLELVKGLFTADNEVRAQQADPYVAYSIEADKFMFNLPPEPVTGPTDNEIWYKTSDDQLAYCVDMQGELGDEVITTYSIEEGNTYRDYTIISHTKNEQGWFVIKCDKPITHTFFMLYCKNYMGTEEKSSNISTLYLPHTITTTFASDLSETVIYKGTMEEWMGIQHNWINMNDTIYAYGDFVSIVHCIDGDITDLPSGMSYYSN